MSNNSTITETFRGEVVRFEKRDDGKLLISMHGRMGGFKGSALVSEQDAQRLSEYLATREDEPRWKEIKQRLSLAGLTRS
jgi:hypothetical protein